MSAATVGIAPEPEAGDHGGVTWIDFESGTPSPRPIDPSWIHGSPSAKHNTDPDIQVVEYDQHTIILRQNMAINYEAPFLFLIFGNTRAVLLDTGATESAEYFPLRRSVDSLLRKWLAVNPRDDYGLLVLHTHAHADHVAADGQFFGRSNTEIVDAPTAYAHFGFDTGPDSLVLVDLGGRVLELLATPGHHSTAITVYDPHDGLLLTGDTVYPGRLYVEDWPAFVRTIDRLIDFATDRPVVNILGCHIEMTSTPGVDYPVRTTYQPDEPSLQMTVDQLKDIGSALNQIGGLPGRYPFSDFVICVDRS
jgi:glyoxylase-like metal-dependent hydrolase (beta-lactamase superfamily II)